MHAVLTCRVDQLFSRGWIATQLTVGAIETRLLEIVSSYDGSRVGGDRELAGLWA